VVSLRGDGDVGTGIHHRPERPAGKPIQAVGEIKNSRERSGATFLRVPTPVLRVSLFHTSRRQFGELIVVDPQFGDRHESRSRN
jgi:hypothetical protein